MQDTYDLLRGAINKVVQAAREDNLSNKLLRKLGRYTRDAKPAIDWADPESRKKELAYGGGRKTAARCGRGPPRSQGVGGAARRLDALGGFETMEVAFAA